MKHSPPEYGSHRHMARRVSPHRVEVKQINVIEIKKNKTIPQSPPIPRGKLTIFTTTNPESESFRKMEAVMDYLKYINLGNSLLSFGTNEGKIYLNIFIPNVGYALSSIVLPNDDGECTIRIEITSDNPNRMMYNNIDLEFMTGFLKYLQSEIGVGRRRERKPVRPIKSSQVAGPLKSSIIDPEVMTKMLKYLENGIGQLLAEKTNEPVQCSQCSQRTHVEPSKLAHANKLKPIKSIIKRTENIPSRSKKVRFDLLKYKATFDPSSPSSAIRDPQQSSPSTRTTMPIPTHSTEHTSRFARFSTVINFLKSSRPGDYLLSFAKDDETYLEVHTRETNIRIPMNTIIHPTQNKPDPDVMKRLLSCLDEIGKIRQLIPIS